MEEAEKQTLQTFRVWCHEGTGKTTNQENLNNNTFLPNLRILT